jgi:hypothetical protein
MPHIPSEWLDSVIYLYPSVPQAQAGERYGGSGFMVSVPAASTPGLSHVYAVTNSHVTAGATVIRMNRPGGGTFIMDLGRDAWFQHPNGDDVAVAPLVFPPGVRHAEVPQSMFLTSDLLDTYGFGPGDEAFSIGRFVNLAGIHENQPVARFGAIARLRGDAIWQPERSFLQDSFLVEMWSLSGFSGSPVFVALSAWLEGNRAGGVVVRLIEGAPCFLLGVAWGHQHWSEPVRDPGKPLGPPVKPPREVQVTSGMTMVVPAWKVAELLDGDDLAELREAAERRHPQ